MVFSYFQYGYRLTVLHWQLCRLLEGELGVKFGLLSQTQESTDAEADEPVSNDYMLQKRASFVSYLDFLRVYWPHFSQNLTKKLGGSRSFLQLCPQLTHAALDPALVFAEFMGKMKFATLSR